MFGSCVTDGEAGDEPLGVAVGAVDVEGFEANPEKMFCLTLEESLDVEDVDVDVEAEGLGLGLVLGLALGLGLGLGVGDGVGLGEGVGVGVRSAAKVAVTVFMDIAWMFLKLYEVTGPTELPSTTTSSNVIATFGLY